MHLLMYPRGGGGGGGGTAGNGWGFDGEILPLSGRFDRVPLLVCFFRQRDWDQVSAWLIFFGKGVGFRVKCSTITLFFKVEV